MITEKDLHEAIAECQGQRNPTSTTCIKLAAYYTILNNIKGVVDDEIRDAPAMINNSYSRTAADDNIVTYQFKDKSLQYGLNGKSINYLCDFIDDVMQALEYLNPELYQFAVKRCSD